MIYFVRRATLCVLAVVLFCCYVSGGLLAQLENRDAANPRVQRSQGNNSHLTTDLLPASAAACNNSTANSTDCKQLSDNTSDQSFLDSLEQAVIRYKDVITRALIVFGSVALVVILYVSFRCIQKRRQMNKSRKYGLITTSASDDKYELRPLDDDDDDDDEDMTVFDRTKPKLLNSQSRRPTNQRSKLNGKRSM